jgi:hypothetical protein
MSRRTAKKPVSSLRKRSVQATESKSLAGSEPLEAIDSCCDMSTSIDSLSEWSRGFESGRESATYDTPAERLKRLRAEVADLTEAIAEHSAALSEAEIKRENRLSAIRRIGTSLGF